MVRSFVVTVVGCCHQGDGEDQDHPDQEPACEGEPGIHSLGFPAGPTRTDCTTATGITKELTKDLPV